MASIKIPVAVVAGFLPGFANLWRKYKEGGWGNLGAEASRIYTGFANTNSYGYPEPIGWHPHLLKYGLLPIVAGFLVHWLVGQKLGINKAISRAGIPLLRI